jgi:hypothetical protein
MGKIKVLIAVKTYPTLSTKYDELVCTAGFKEDGTWIRLFPIQYRQRPYGEQYAKYQWIEIDVVKNEKDFRPESFRPTSIDAEIKIVGEIRADGKHWSERRRIVLKKVYHNLAALIAEAKDPSQRTSLAVFKPKEVLDFIIEPEEREWDREKLEHLKQANLFESAPGGLFKVVRKLPYKFSYKFVDEDGKQSTLMIEDWEIGQLYWNSLKRHEGNEVMACDDVRKKYFDDLVNTKDLHLFLGTTLQFHVRNAPNPFIIIGIFYPKPETQFELF